MSINKVFAAALACLAFGSSLAWGQCTDPWTTSTIRNCNDIDYELWNQNNSGTVSMTITGGSTNPNGGSFEASWQGTENVLFRSGRKWGSSSTTTASSLGGITYDFAANWSSTDNVKMLGVYGWAYYPAGASPANFSNQIEYYIIQDRGSYNPGAQANNSIKQGEATINGIEYELFIGDRINQPMLTGNGNFKQYFSVPKNTSSHRTSGTIDVASHFQAWHDNGMRMMDCPLYEIAMKVESYTGPGGNSNGSATVTRALLTLGGGPITPSEFSLVTNVSPAGSGTVTKSPNTSTYAPNASVQLTATPSSGWRFVGWEGDASGSTSPTTVTMSSNRTVTARFELISGESTINLITDGNFPSASVITTGDGASWKLGQGEYWGNSVATSSVSNGTATINVTTIGTESYQPQLVQYGLALDQNMRYKLTFKARAASARAIEVSFQQSVDPWASYASQEFDLTTSEQDYEFVFTMTSASDPASQFAFNLGQATGSVYISDVRLVHTTDGPTTAIRNQSVLSNGSGTLLVSLNDRTLNVTPVDGSILQIRVIDVKGKVRANFNTADVATFSLSNMPTGLYFVDITGTGLKQFTPIVLE